MPKSSEDPDYSVPRHLHKTTLVKLLKALPNIPIEVTDKEYVYMDFRRDRKDLNFGKCSRIFYPLISICEDECRCNPLNSIQLLSIPYQLKINYVGIVNNTLLYTT